MMRYSHAVIAPSCRLVPDIQTIVRAVPELIARAFDDAAYPGRRINQVALMDVLRDDPDQTWAMARSMEEQNRRMLRARDAMDRDYARPLDLAQLAAIAHASEAHFIRTFRITFGETPHRYLQRRRVERAMFLLRTTDRSVTDICMEVGFSSLGTFSRTFRDIVGESPSQFRGRGPMPEVPSCYVKTWTRPSSFGEALDRSPP
jgi:AraC-like DNA-binding protein